MVEKKDKRPGASWMWTSLPHAGPEPRSLRRRCGFSPNQLVGKEPRLPADLVDGTAELSAHDRVLNNVTRRFRVRTATRPENMMQNDHSLRRALRCAIMS